jgi:heat shock protein HslJ
MKTMILIQLITSVLILINMGCTKENEPIKTNDGNDTIPVHDTLTNDTLTLCDSAICTFDSICLDYHFYDTIDKTKLIGEWKLIAYVDTINCEIVNEPSNIPRNIVLNFYENDSISGESVSNSITGKYSINSNKISLYDLNITLVMEPEWGRTFLESINYTEYFTIKNSLLIINSKEILIFQKNNL